MEPERPIEKLLRTWAKRRGNKAGAPLEMHPATRRLLQGEVARKFGGKQRETGRFAAMLRQLWPRFIWGLAIFVALAVTAGLLLPIFGKAKSKGTFARNERMLRSEPPRAAPEQPAIAAAEDGRAPGIAGAKPQEGVFFKRSGENPPGAAPAASPAPAVNMPLARNYGLGGGAVPASDGAPGPATQPRPGGTVAVAAGKAIGMDEV